MGAGALVGLIVCAGLSSGAAALGVSAMASQYRTLGSYQCELYAKIKAEVDAAMQQLQVISGTLQVADDTYSFLGRYGGNVKALAESLQRQSNAFKRNLATLAIVEAVITMLLVYVLIRRKEHRDSILNFL